ncbi:MAG TPA: MucB/RseB C-terminal domain-containing protein [Burkholderiales bacterium]|nr:MucB/RseB C-terminal domain-containing protein [Burkholderiales bacterium]
MLHRPAVVRVCVIVLLGAVGSSRAADGPSAGTQDGVAWLKKMAAASRQLNYTGTIVYQHRNQVETSRVVHYVNAAGGEFEKLETLDGPPREIIRSNDQVVCYLPAVKTVLIEERNRSSRNFPALLPESLGGIAENYDIRKGEVDRAAEHECQWITLKPRDNLRYGRRFCAEVGSGLPLRAQTMGEKGERIESFAFTQLTIGGAFSRERVKSKYADRSRTQNWRIDRSGFTPSAGTPADTGWTLSTPLPGFKKLMEARRSIGGPSRTVSQIVFSDGLAAVSVFIEAMPTTQPAQSMSHQGSVNIYTRPHGNHVVTVLGEAPQATIQRIGDSLEHKPTTASLQ